MTGYRVVKIQHAGIDRKTQGFSTDSGFRKVKYLQNRK